jgi:PilZ domain
LILPARNEQRRTPRHAVRQIATILTGSGRIARYCLIEDRSAGGVRLRTRSDFEAPSEFDLRFADTETTYKIVWRNGQLVGAERVGRVKRLPVRRFGMR